MSRKNNESSDEEFQDAEDVDPSQIAGKSNEVIIEELIENYTELKASAEEGNDDSKDETQVQAGEVVQPELLDDIIDEEALKEKEKGMSEEELRINKEQADKLKLEGNELFKNEEAMRSIEIYTEALKICPSAYPKDRAILYGNRAAAKIKIDSKKSATDDCTNAINLWPEYVRALLRRAKLYECDDKLDEALSDYKRVVELDPGQAEAREAVYRLPPLIQERNEKLKEEMMSKLKDLGNIILKPFGLSTANFKMQQDPNTGGYSINFNQ